MLLIRVVLSPGRDSNVGRHNNNKTQMSTMTKSKFLNYIHTYTTAHYLLVAYAVTWINVI